MTKEIHAVIAKEVYNEVHTWCEESLCDENEFIQNALRCFLTNCRKRQIEEKMKFGYEEMSPINAEYAELSLALDVNELCSYEVVLNKREVKKKR